MYYQENNSIPDEFIHAMENNRECRIELIEYFQKSKERNFAITLLDKIVTSRAQGKEVTGDTIMLACYLLGLHNCVEDCMRIWQAKKVDFDAFCYIDIQLVPFAGWKETVHYLTSINSKESQEALDYLNQCNRSGDFDNLTDYYDKNTLPWFV
jgi:hypothetical protein